MYTLFYTAIIVMFVQVQVAIATAKWIDLSYPFVENETIYWPGNPTFQHDVVFKGMYAKDTFLLSLKLAGAEHGGTHIDAPNHFIKDGISLDKVTIDRLVGDGIVVNISAKAANDPNAELEISDLEEWEKKHGRIPDNPVVFLYSGRGNVWPDPVKYFGSNTPMNESTLNFPGLHVDAATWLVEKRKIKLFGLDTPSFDRGTSVSFPTHKVLLGAGVPGIENVAYLDRLPPRGFEVFAFPMKIKGGSGGPVRVFARIADKTDVSAAAATHAYVTSTVLAIATTMALFVNN